MTIKEQIEIDLKKAMLSGDKVLATTLRGLKSVILYAEVASGARDLGIDNEEVIKLFQKESKKRQESADLFAKGGNAEKQQQELNEKKVIDAYLPAQMSEEDIQQAVAQAIEATDAKSMQDMGKVVGLVKQQLGSAADGSIIARIVRERLVS